jgi:predicted RecB family nuclease
MRELARWFAEAVSVVPGCGEGEAEMLLQSGVTSLDDLARCTDELLTSLPGVDEAGAVAIRQRATELEAERAAEEARAAAELAASVEASLRTDGAR